MMNAHRYVVKGCQIGAGILRYFDGEPPATVEDPDGQTLHLEALRSKEGSRTACGTWPMTSAFAGCHPDDIPTERAHDEKNGLTGTQYKRDGDVVWNSPGHRRRWLESRGMHDRNAGYSDPVPK